MKNIITSLLLVVSISAFAQTGIGTTTPNASAQLDVSSTNKGFLPPRVALTSTSSASPLAAHVAGMVVYNTATVSDVTPGLYVDNGSAWEKQVAATTLTGLTSTVAELNTLDGFTGTVADLNYAKDLAATGVTNTAFSYLDGVTSNIQTQLNGKLSTTGNAATATKLANARTINNITFDGSANITGLEPYIYLDNTMNYSRYLTFTKTNSTSEGYRESSFDTDLYYNPSTNTLTATNFNGTAAIATNLSSDVTASGALSYSGDLSTGDVAISHRTGAGYNHVPTGGSAGQFLKYSSSGTAIWATPSYTVDTKNPIENNLTSTSTTSSLSANMGKTLQNTKLNLTGGTITGDLTVSGKATFDSSVEITGYTYYTFTDNYNWVGSTQNTIGYSTTDNANLSIKAANKIMATGFYAYSDKRIKEDITPIENALEIINKLRPVTYKKIDKQAYGNKTYTGFIAQEVKKVIPSAVTIGKGDIPVLKSANEMSFEEGVKYKIQITKDAKHEQQEYIGGTELPEGDIYVISREIGDFHSIEYDVLYTHAIKAIQEQQNTIKTLQKGMQEQQVMIDELKKVVSTLVKK